LCTRFCFVERLNKPTWKWFIAKESLYIDLKTEMISSDKKIRESVVSTVNSKELSPKLSSRTVPVALFSKISKNQFI